MPLISHTKDPIIVNIADRVDGNTIIKRKALFLRMEYKQGAQLAANGALVGPGAVDFPKSQDSVILFLTIQLFAAGAKDEATGEYAYGDRLSGKPGYQDYPREIIANNTTIVDQLTGDVLCEAAVYENAVRVSTNNNLPLETVLPDVLKGRNFMYEGERFRWVAETQQIPVDPTIIDYIQKAIIP